MVYFATGGHGATALAAALALVGSGITSYLMVLATSHGYVLRAGLLRRQDRVALLAAGLLLSPLHAPLSEWIGPGAADLPNLPLATDAGAAWREPESPAAAHSAWGAGEGRWYGGRGAA